MTDSVERKSNIGIKQKELYGVKMFLCEIFDCWMTPVGCSGRKEVLVTNQVRRTKTLKYPQCRDCEGVQSK